jgi:hypothetical protein
LKNHFRRKERKQAKLEDQLGQERKGSKPSLKINWGKKGNEASQG